METEQVKFKDPYGEIRGGILVKGAEEGDFIICGCCGGIFYVGEDVAPDSIESYWDDWVDLTPFITGEEGQDK